MRSLEEISKAPRVPPALARAATVQIAAEEPAKQRTRLRKPRSQAPDGLGNSRFKRSVEAKIEQQRIDPPPPAEHPMPTYLYRSGSVVARLPDPLAMQKHLKSPDYYLDPG